MKRSHKHERGAWASDLSQDELEKQKVALEIEQLREPWWKRPGYLAIALPGILAFATLIVGVSTGFFRNQYDLIQIKNEKAELEQRLLEQDKQKLNQDKDALKVSIVDLQNRKQLLIDESVANELKFTQQQERLSAELQKITNDRTMASFEALERRQKLEREERQLTADFEKRKEELTSQITHLENETLLKPFREKLIPDALFRGSYSEIFSMLSEEKERLPLYLGAVEQELDDPKLDPVGRDMPLLILYTFTKNKKWLDEFDKWLQDQVLTSHPKFGHAQTLRHAADYLEQKDRYRFSERIIELLMQHPEMEDDSRSDYLDDIYFLLEKEEVNHIKPFTRRDRFFDLLQMDRDICLRSGRTCEALELLAPEGFWVTLAKIRTESDEGNLARDWTPSHRQAQEVGVKLGVPGPNDVAGWKAWLKGHQELKELWLDDKQLQKLKTNPSLLNHS